MERHEGQHGSTCDPCAEILVIRPEILNQPCGCQPLEDMCPLHAAAPDLLAALIAMKCWDCEYPLSQADYAGCYSCIDARDAIAKGA